MGGHGVVDSGALAVALGISPSMVRKLVSQGKLQPLGRWRRLRPTGRPVMWFSLERAAEAMDSP